MFCLELNVLFLPYIFIIISVKIFLYYKLKVINRMDKVEDEFY